MRDCSRHGVYVCGAIMKKIEVKKHINRDVRVAYVKGKQVIKTDAHLNSADPLTELAEVWCVNGDRVLVHFSQLRPFHKVKKTVEEQLQGEVESHPIGKTNGAYRALIDAYKTLKFYGDSRSWMESTSGKYLGQIMDVKWNAAAQSLKVIEQYVEENFL